MRRRHIHQARRGRDRIDDQSIGVHGHTDDRQPVRPEEFDRRWIARLLDRHDVARPDQHPHHEVHAVQRARGHHHFLGRGHDTTGPADPMGQRRS